MPSLSEQDEKIAREILKVLYDQFEDVQYRGVTGDALYDALDEYDQDNVAYVADRIDELEAQLAEKNERLHAVAVELRRLKEDRV